MKKNPYVIFIDLKKNTITKHRQATTIYLIKAEAYVSIN